MPSKLGATAKLWLLVCVTPYCVLSFLLYGVRHSASIQDAVSVSTGVLWLAGPAALLLVALRDSLSPYLVGTCIFLTGSFVTIHLARRWSSWCISVGLATLAIWVFFGVLVYLPMV